jgi:hypothetical protein
MKKLLVIIAILISGTCIAQQSDSTINVSVEQLKQSLIFMRTNLDKFEKKNSLGVEIAIMGAASTIGGFAFDNNSKDPNTKTDKDPFIIGGVAAFLVGVAISMDSHKYIVRAGRWKFSPAGTIAYDISKE